MTIAICSNRLSFSLLQVIDIDPSTLDAIEEEEDNEVQIDTINEESENENENEDCPNNDFCWTEADFIQQYTDMNDATRHRGVLSDSWKKIHELEGHTVEVENRTEGKVVWKVIKECVADEFADVRAYEQELFDSEEFNVGKESINTDWDYNKSFWYLWGGTIDEDVSIINESIMSENRVRRDKYQRPIRILSKSEYVTFKALLIAASVHNKQGAQLWLEVQATQKKK